MAQLTGHDQIKQPEQMTLSCLSIRPAVIVDMPMLMNATKPKVVTGSHCYDANVVRKPIHFPDEIWSAIFSHMAYPTLNKMHLVSKNFRTILSAPRFDAALFRLRPDIPPPAAYSSTETFHPFLTTRSPYQGVPGRECLVCHDRRHFGQICAESDRAVAFAENMNLKTWRLETTSVAGDAATWPPRRREQFPYFFEPDEAEERFVTVAQFVRHNNRRMRVRGGDG